MAAAQAKKEKAYAQKSLDLSKFKPRQLKAYMARLFKIGDKDGNGTLDKAELKTLLGMSGFKFSVASVEEALLLVCLNPSHHGGCSVTAPFPRCWRSATRTCTAPTRRS